MTHMKVIFEFVLSEEPHEWRLHAHNIAGTVLEATE